MLANIVFYFWRTTLIDDSVSDGSVADGSAANRVNGPVAGRHGGPGERLILLGETGEFGADAALFIKYFGVVSRQTGALIETDTGFVSTAYGDNDSPDKGSKVAANPDKPGSKDAGRGHGRESIADTECLRLGPFLNHQAADTVLNRLSALEFDVVLENRLQEASSEYLVFIPSLASTEAAKLKQKELRDHGFDSFEFGDGKLKNALSVGYFNVERNALARQKQLALKGYHSKIDITINKINQFWVAVPRSAAGILSVEFWTDMSLTHPQIKAYTGKCV
jgi:hypothetical protein